MPRINEAKKLAGANIVDFSNLTQFTLPINTLWGGAPITGANAFDSNGADLTYVNDAAENDFYSVIIPANTVRLNDKLVMEIDAMVSNNSGLGSKGASFRLYVNGISRFREDFFLLDGSTNLPIKLKATIFNLNSLSSQFCTFESVYHTTQSTGSGPEISVTGAAQEMAANISNANFAVPQTIQMTVQLNLADPNVSVSRRGAQLRILGDGS